MDYIQLLVYSIVGGIIFGILGSIATKYRGDIVNSTSIGRDTVSGAIFLLFLQFLVPGYFPQLNVSSVVEHVRTIGGGEGYDMDLQFTMPVSRH
jgi:hypothetical protein